MNRDETSGGIPSFDPGPDLEPERYEFREDPAWDFQLGRREFLRTLGGGLLILCVGLRGDAEVRAQESGRNGRRRGGGGQLPQAIDAWVHVGEDGTVTAFTGKVEVGQNARTSLTQAVADELTIPVASVRMVMGDTDRVPYDIGTFGSLTTPRMVPLIRRAAAAARALLASIAAERWGVDRGTVEIRDGKAFHATSGRSLGFGELTSGRKLVETIGEDVRAIPAPEWKAAGKSVPKVDARRLVTGEHRYTSDMKRPGMLRGKVLRPPAPGAKLASLDASKAEAMPDVKVVRDGDFVGVVAPTEHEAGLALAALRPQWTALEPPRCNDRTLYEYLKAHPEGGLRNRDRQTASEAGPVGKELASAHAKVSSRYTVAYIAHAPLEPRAAVAEWDGDRLTVRAGTQRPFGGRSELAEAFRMPEERVRVIVPDTGSGYGGKHTGEALVEAARLAHAAGKPVKLVWTREEEFQWAYFRPAGLIEASAGADRDGKLVAWDFHNYNSGSSGLTSPYACKTKDVAFHATGSPLRQGSYRALAATANHFARESLMDELAHALELDPLEFRMRNLEDPRLCDVYRDAAEKFGWGKSRPPEGHGYGFAGGAEKGGYVATCVEVAVEKATRAVRVVRAVAAFECGAIVNPDQLRNQVEGCLVMGLGGALGEAIRFEDGKVLNPRFSRYRVPRFGDIPKIDVVLRDRRDLPAAGAGEIPIVAIAPAIANAIFDATGVRIRSMPMVPDGVIPAAEQKG
ncbi:Nicotinate dehydrogenase subunit B [Aquisphaera giovannonii]|uniref:Nicotinate dehydrogenase subunit B n=1 Tax=Aquisphaera giovannonii TaxID=406548 RepID=A0A5B9WBD7_9BACT|nr:molybdopterin cofactor-binding domain-containing protein [Aquisphaera giovannonii]QEH37200.1 Nicotinate dehydrogenase subunit B [Aquisphaera giovannonii]